MQFRNINVLTRYSPALDALTARQRAALVEIVFCYRFGALSATAVFGDVEPLRDVAGQVPAGDPQKPRHGRVDMILSVVWRCADESRKPVFPF